MRYILKHIKLLITILVFLSSYPLLAQDEDNSQQAERILNSYLRNEAKFTEKINHLIREVVFTNNSPELKKEPNFIDNLKIKLIPFFYLNEKVNSVPQSQSFLELLEIDTIKYQFLAYCFKDTNLVLFISFHNNCNVLNPGGEALDYNYEFELYNSPNVLNKDKEGLNNYFDYFKDLFDNNYQLFYVSGMYADGVFFIDKNTNNIRFLNKNAKKNIIENPSDYFLDLKNLNYLKKKLKECNPNKKYETKERK